VYDHWHRKPDPAALYESPAMSADAPTPDFQATTDVVLLAERYQLLDKLGEGGMGAVFRAHDAQLDRSVAVKILPAGKLADREAVGRFRREAKALAKLSHPGIIQAFDSGADGDKHFLVMELVAGRSLGQELAEKGRLSPTRAADYAYQAALALQHAHEHGLVHRDVKPSNLLVGSDGRVKLLDLGLARFLQDQVGDATLTRENAGMGTPDYVAPEQFRDAHRADPRSDIYSLGCTLYQLIAGEVPFPGSSLSEKLQGHESRQPHPLEEFCPDVPGGLALLVGRMMAKRSADRFQSMEQVAEALHPYVAGASGSFTELRKTATWDGSRLSTMMATPRRRLSPVWLIAGATFALVLVAGGVLGGLAGWFSFGTRIAAQDTGAELGSPTGAQAESQPNGEVPGTASDPNVLTVAQKPGIGRFQTIAAALSAVRPGQTVRVVDNATYRESLRITNRTDMAGITLEATAGAALALDLAGERSWLLDIAGVPNVTVRGFRFHAARTPRSTLIVVRSQCPGLRLEQLALTAAGSPGTNGLEIYGSAGSAPDRAPAIVRNCIFRGLAVGTIFVAGPGNSFFHTAVRDCQFMECDFGVQFSGGSVQAVQVVGNRFRAISVAAVQFLFVGEKSENLLLANNTFFENATTFRIWDRAIHGTQVQVRNNLVLGSEGMDMHTVDAVEAQESRGPGDGAAVAKTYRLSHNWREGKDWKAEKGWIPPDAKKGDVLAAKIEDVNRDPKSATFLRPEAKSPLATAGAGNEDPSLPRYVGALPPEGTEPWDWDRAWRMPKDAQLLTVSKESGGGKYRAINEALKDAKPWATVRVLDAASYAEGIDLTDRKKYEGLTLEATNGAALQLASGARRNIFIEDVPHVRVTGFRCTEAGSLAPGAASRSFVVVSGAAQGTALSRLVLIPKTPMIGIVLQNAVAARGEPPLRVEHCAVRPECAMSNDGVSVIGALEADASGGICIRSSQFTSCGHGVNLLGALRDVQVTGNLLVKCPFTGLQTEDLAPDSRNLLFANNTAFAGSAGFRVWYNSPYKQPQARQVEVANNIFFGATEFDAGYLLNDVKNTQQAPGDCAELLKLWHFHHNRRDFSGSGAAFRLPLSPEDGRFKREELLSVATNELDRVRPAKDSPLATQGAGAIYDLPSYIGALPPEGVPPWDWDRTWLGRLTKNPEPN
jgi:hypothetical protein